MSNFFTQTILPEESEYERQFHFAVFQRETPLKRFSRNFPDPNLDWVIIERYRTLKEAQKRYDELEDYYKGCGFYVQFSIGKYWPRPVKRDVE